MLRVTWQFLENFHHYAVFPSKYIPLEWSSRFHRITIYVTLHDTWIYDVLLAITLLTVSDDYKLRITYRRRNVLVKSQINKRYGLHWVATHIRSIVHWKSRQTHTDVQRHLEINLIDQLFPAICITGYRWRRKATCLLLAVWCRSSRFNGSMLRLTAVKLHMLIQKFCDTWDHILISKIVISTDFIWKTSIKKKKNYRSLNKYLITKNIILQLQLLTTDFYWIVGWSKMYFI